MMSIASQALNSNTSDDSDYLQSMQSIFAEPASTSQDASAAAQPSDDGLREGAHPSPPLPWEAVLQLGLQTLHRWRITDPHGQQPVGLYQLKPTSLDALLCLASLHPLPASLALALPQDPSSSSVQPQDPSSSSAQPQDPSSSAQPQQATSSASLHQDPPSSSWPQMMTATQQQLSKLIRQLHADVIAAASSLSGLPEGNWVFAYVIRRAFTTKARLRLDNSSTSSVRLTQVICAALHAD